MASERFDKLAESKKKQIFNSVKKMLCEKPYDKISVSDIAENTNISRGAFYTYFVDKRDIMKTFCMSEAQAMCEFCKVAIQENNGDYFKAITEVYEVIKERGYKNYKDKNFVNFSFINDIVLELFGTKEFHDLIDEFCIWCKNNVSKKCFGENISVLEIQSVNSLCMQIVINTLTEINILNKDNDKKFVDDLFNIKIKIIKNGVLAL